MSLRLSALEAWRLSRHRQRNRASSETLPDFCEGGRARHSDRYRDDGVFATIPRVGVCSVSLSEHG